MEVPELDIEIDALSPEALKNLFKEYHRRFWALISKGKICSVCIDLQVTTFCLFCSFFFFQTKKL